jgi:hypothetical protein
MQSASVTIKWFNLLYVKQLYEESLNKKKDQLVVL